MERLPAACLGLLVVAVLGAPAQGLQYDAVLYSATGGNGPYFGYVTLVDLVRGKVTTVWSLPGTMPGVGQRTRGGVAGPDGLLYLGLWDHNGIAGFDPNTGAFTTFVVDPANVLLGAPYQPAPNYDNVGGFGFYVIDGNQPSAPAPLTGMRNTTRVDMGRGRFEFDGWFPNREVDMGDFYPHLFKPGSFVGVPQSSTDLTITEYPLATNPPQALAVTTLVTLPSRAHYDACWAEDGNLYVWGGSTRGVHVVDLRRRTTTLVRIQGITEPAAAAFWEEPWERPGMKGHLLGRSQSALFTVDLAARPIVATKTTLTLPFNVYFFVNTGRNAEEGQLWSWWTGPPGERTFQIRFGPAGARRRALLLPSLAGLAPRPLLVNGLELYLAVDGLTLLALRGLLPYAPVVTLDARGSAAVRWRGFGRRLGLGVYWMALLLGPGGGVVDASNLIHVNM